MASAKKCRLKYRGPGGATEAGPVVACFPQGPPPPSALGGAAAATDSSDFASPIEFTLYGNTAAAVDAKRSQRIVYGQSSAMEYEGRNFGEMSARKSLSKYVVGVFDKGSASLELFDAGNVFSLTQRVKGKEGAAAVDTEAGYLARRKMLIDTFGSKKHQREQLSRETNVIDAGLVAGADAVTRSLHGAKGASGAAAGTSGSTADEDAHRRTYLPPYDATAATPQAAYPVEGFIGADVGRALMPGVTAMIKALKASDKQPLVDAACGSSYVLGHLEMLRTASGSTAEEKKRLKLVVRVLLYMAALMRLRAAPERLRPGTRGAAAGGAGAGAGVPAEETDIPALTGLPPAMVRHMLDTFADRQTSPDGTRVTFVKTGPLEDKLVVYLALCTLIVDNYQLDISVLAGDLEMRALDLRERYRALGCTYKGAAKKRAAGADGDDSEEADGSGAGASSVKKSSYHVVLRAPLKFPAIKRGGKARR